MPEYSLERARALSREGNLGPLERRFADFLVSLEGGASAGVYLAGLAVIRATAEGSICADLASIAGRPASEFIDESGDALCYPPLAEWKRKILKSGVVGRPGEFTPLILDGNDRLYLYRYWRYERRLAENIMARLGNTREPADPGLLRGGLDRLFADAPADEINWQKVAALNAVLNGFSVISGGPGTGKSRTVARILALLIEQSIACAEDISIAICAPTGKAAARLQESINAARGELACGDHVLRRLPDTSYTIHRLLGPLFGSPYFRHDSGNPLPHDVVVVDESSMADLALMSKLADAVKPGSRLILLGDRDQLSSVEAGAVLGDICDTGKEHAYSARFTGAVKQFTGEDLSSFSGDLFGKPIADSIVILRKSYRFSSASGIGALGRAVRDGDASAAIEALSSDRYPDVRLIEPGERDLEKTLHAEIDKGAFAFSRSSTPEDAFEAYARFTVLCAHRQGPHGVEGINDLVERELGRRGRAGDGGRFYAGRPVMVTRNDHQQRLYNGDIGILLADRAGSGATEAVFRTDGGGYRYLSPVRIPEHRTVYAMTVHKSQGSEFGSVLLVLSETLSPVLTRELIYTAITRARETVTVWGSARSLRHAIENPVSRASGLRDILWS